MSVLSLGSACCLAVVFAAAAFSKLRGAAAFAAFEESVRELTGRPHRTVRHLAVPLVAAELAVPVLLPAGPTRPAGLLLAALLLLGFTAAIGRTLARGVRTTCRCFGAGAAPLGPPHLVRNAVLAVLALAGLPGAGGLPAPGPALLAAATGLVLGLLAVRLDDIHQLLRPVS